MRNVEIIMTGYVSNLIERIWGSTGFDCINIYKAGDEIFNDYFELYTLHEIMQNKIKYPDEFYIELTITQEEESKYITLLNIGMSSDDLFKTIYEENKHRPSTEY